MMRIAVLDTYYPRFLSHHYAAHKSLGLKSYGAQKEYLLSQVFGTSDFYSRHLGAMGHEVQDLIVNCEQLQKAWANENAVYYSQLAMKLPQRMLRMPLIGPWLSALSGLVEIAVKQVKDIRPDVLYCQDLWFFAPQQLIELRPYVKLIVGQTASPLPPDAYLSGYDLILTSFPHFVPRLRNQGLAAEYFRIGFDKRVLELLGDIKQDKAVSFVGGISRHHGNALPMLEHLATRTPIEFYGYGADSLKKSSPIKNRHNGEVWGLNMYRSLARSRIAFNRHINVAENYANNMRLYEATGVGSLLITDQKDNLHELFEVGKEVLTYSSPEEAVDLINYYVDHPEEASNIARAGQDRTLREHTYQQRMAELVPILERYMPIGGA